MDTSFDADCDCCPQNGTLCLAPVIDTHWNIPCVEITRPPMMLYQKP